MTDNTSDIITLDPDGEMPIIGYCIFCSHLNREKGALGERVCDAFENIPVEIWKGENKHTSPYPGDHGITFQKR